MVKINIRNSAFTLTELLIASVIVALIFAGAFTIYTLCYKTWMESSASVSIQRDGSIACESLTRGVKAENESKKNGIREAKSFTIYADAKTIKFKSGIDGKDRLFYLSGEKIMYDPDPSVPNGEIVIAKNVKDLSFEKITARRIKVSVLLGTKVGVRPLYMALETEVTIRN